MQAWQPQSLLPIIGLSLLLAVGVLLRDRSRWPLAAYCLSLACWAVSVGLAGLPETRELGANLLMVGFFLPATFTHVVADEIGGSRLPVIVNYSVATGFLVSSLAVGDLYLTAGGTSPGPLFAPMFAATLVTGAIPLGWLWGAEPEPGRTETRRYLLLAGAATSGGGALHILLSLSGNSYPLGLYLLLSGIGLLTYVALAAELPSFSRFAERSQRYTLLAALLSTVWMLALLTASGGEGSWTWESALLLFVLTLTAQPLLTEARSRLASVVVPGADAEGLTRALAKSEARAEHAERLAEIGRLSSAVAHEVRNPLGVISACVAMLERQGADEALLEEVRGAVDRANRFSAELLDYGRPSEVRLHPVSLRDVADVAAGEVSRALSGLEGPGATIEMDGDCQLAVDASQLTRLLAILLENAWLAGAGAISVAITEEAPGAVITVTDDGPGVPEELQASVFEPFVTGRGRDAPRPGTGLGLAIAAGIADRHGGTLRLAASNEGAAFEIRLPIPEHGDFSG